MANTGEPFVQHSVIPPPITHLKNPGYTCEEGLVFKDISEVPSYCQYTAL